MFKDLPPSAGDIRDKFHAKFKKIPGGGPDNPLLTWRIPRTEEPDRLWSIGLQRAGHTKAT